MSPSEVGPDEAENKDLPDDEADIESRWQAIIADLADVDPSGELAREQARLNREDPQAKPRGIVDARDFTAGHFLGPRDWEVTPEVEAELDSFVPPQDFEPLSGGWQVWAAWTVITLALVMLFGVLMFVTAPPAAVPLTLLVCIAGAGAYLFSRLPGKDEQDLL